MHEVIPQQVLFVGRELTHAGFAAYAVGGCVRDVLLGREPSDWDVATNAKPEEIQKVFPKSFYENKFGTVTALVDGHDCAIAPLERSRFISDVLSESQNAIPSRGCLCANRCALGQTGSMEIQITTYRVDNAYSDKRHPDSVKYTNDLTEDLARRDFTVNAMALELKSEKEEAKSYEIIDPFYGQKDLKEKIIRAVGDANERFNEDALRLVRAVRFATQLGFIIEAQTLSAVKKHATLIRAVSQERIRDELMKIIMCKNAADGIDLLREVGLLQFIMPELLDGYHISQNKHHIFDVYEHNVKSLRYAAEQGFSFTVRFAALLHDVGKPKAKQGEGPNATFYNHDMVGARIAAKAMSRLKFSNKEIEDVTRLIRYHLFYYNVDEVTASSVRRLVRNVGLENMDDLISVRLSDRIGSGVPKAEPYKLRHFRYMVDMVSKDPISVKMLKIDGNEVMRLLDIKPGPKVGIILNALFSEVLDDPQKNDKDYLERRAGELNKFSISELSEMIKKGEEKVKLLEEEDQRKFRV
ncbi:MAG: HD domain-containing protein [Candidatus Azambacteria bacterium]|nr:HD domain-containing protein [Candidatus Azambacteria bacterium]